MDKKEEKKNLISIIASSAANIGGDEHVVDGVYHKDHHING